MSKIYINLELVNPVEFVLPLKSDIKNFYSDDVGNHYGSYKINIEDQVELLTFLENLDNLCIDSAAQNSDLWFKKIRFLNYLLNIIIRYMKCHHQMIFYFYPPKSKIYKILTEFKN